MTHRGHCPVVLTAYTGGSSSCSALPLLVRTRRNEPFVLPEGTPLGTSGSDGRRSPCLRRARSPIYLSSRDPNSRSPFPDPRDHRSQITTHPRVPSVRKRVLSTLPNPVCYRMAMLWHMPCITCGPTRSQPRDARNSPTLNSAHRGTSFEVAAAHLDPRSEAR